MPRFKKATKVQSIMFDRLKWTVSESKKWLKDHGYKVPAVDTTSDYHRFRQAPPFQFQKGTFRTISFGASSLGIKTVIAVPKIKKNPSKKTKTAWLPTFLVDIAIPISIDIEGNGKLKFAAKDNWSLAANRAGNELWIVSKRGGKKVKASDERGEKLYELFTGFEHDEKGTMINLSVKQMQKIGRAMDIVYRSDKFSRSGKMSDYIHSFDIYPTVSVDNKKKPTIIAIRGGKIKIKQEGITG